MTLDQALAVYLVLHDSELGNWNREVLGAALSVIREEADKAIEQWYQDQAQASAALRIKDHTSSGDSLTKS